MAECSICGKKMSNRSKEFAYVIEKDLNKHKVVCNVCLEKLLKKENIIYYR